jgi:MFS family permease
MNPGTRSAAPTARNAYRLLWAGFFAIFASGVGFAVRTRVLTLWAADYGFTMTELGEITGGGLVGFGIVILAGSLIADRIGYGRLMILALVAHLLSAILQLCTGAVFDKLGRDGVYWNLYIAMFLFSIGNGICEAVVNPVVATLFPHQKTHYLNILHAGWPGGMIVGGLVAYFMNGGGIGDWVPIGNVHWLWQMSIFLIPVVFYGLLVLGQSFPKSEAGQAGVGYFTMLLQVLSPVFVLLLVLHALVGYVELGTDSWIGKISGNILDNNANFGLLLFIYTSGLMFLLRFFGGPIEHRLSPLGLLCAGAALGCIGLLLLSVADGIAFCVLAVTVYGAGKTFLWPTMLAVASERFPKGGAITIGMMGGVGALSAGLLGGPGIGFKQDYYATQELKRSSSLQSYLPTTYERYVSKEENHFLIFTSKGLDGKKTNILNLESQLSIWAREDLSADTPPERKQDLAFEIRNAKQELETALGDPPLKTWWDTQGEPHMATDKELVDQAALHGSRMALALTAAVPATMAVLYLLLIWYFRLRGGYTKEVVLTTAAPGSEF